MMTQAYFNGGDLDSFHRSQYRNMNTAAYYDRAAPYAHYDHIRQDFRPEYSDRQHTHTMIHEPDSNGQAEQPRRRIAVACSRCRRRKIKCTGDPGDGSGCAACKTSGADVSSCCTFIRVGSEPMAMPGVEMLSYGNKPQGPCGSIAYTSSPPANNRYATARYQTRSRPSLPTLHTRSTFPMEYESQYEVSPIETYGYSSMVPRQDSFASTYGLENYRSWSTTTAPMSAPATVSYSEPHSSYSFGSIQAPSIPPHQMTGRPHGTPTEPSPAWNMGHLNSSLPSQTVQERRLPIPAPNTLQYTQTPYSTAEVPEIRPLGSYTEPKVHITGIHSRDAMPWSVDSTSSTYRRGSMANATLPSGLLNSSSQSMIPVSDPVLGYQWSVAGPATVSGSPEVSPKSGPALSEGFPSTSSSSTTSMLPPSRIRYSAPNTHNMPNTTTDDRPSSSRGNPTTASLYSFSTETSDPQANHFEPCYLPSTRHSRNSVEQGGSAYAGSGIVDSSASYSIPMRQSRNSLDYSAGTYPTSSANGTTTSDYANTIRQPQPQHATSIDALCRQSSFEHPQRASTAQRMSVSNFSSHH